MKNFEKKMKIFEKTFQIFSEIFILAPGMSFRS